MILNVSIKRCGVIANEQDEKTLHENLKTYNLTTIIIGQCTVFDNEQKPIRSRSQAVKGSNMTNVKAIQTKKLQTCFFQQRPIDENTFNHLEPLNYRFLTWDKHIQKVSVLNMFASAKPAPSPGQCWKRSTKK